MICFQCKFHYHEECQEEKFRDLYGLVNHRKIEYASMNFEEDVQEARKRKRPIKEIEELDKDD